LTLKRDNVIIKISGAWRRVPRLYFGGLHMKATTSRFLTHEDKTRANHRLASYGLKLGSGSLEAEKNKLNAFIVPQTCAVTYNGSRVAKVLMDEFEVEEAVIDGRLYVRADVERDVKVWEAWTRRPLYY